MRASRVVDELVAVAPDPALASGAADVYWYVNVVLPVTVMVQVPLYPAGTAPAMATWEAVGRPWLVAVVTVARLRVYWQAVSVPAVASVTPVASVKVSVVVAVTVPIWLFNATCVVQADIVTVLPTARPWLALFTVT